MSNCLGKTALYGSIIVALLAAWSAIAVAMTLAMPAGRPVAIIGSPAHIVGVVADAGGLLLTSSRMMVIARSDDPGFVRRLYAAGALIVLDAEDAGGCSGLSLAARLMRKA